MADNDNLKEGYTSPPEKKGTDDKVSVDDSKMNSPPEESSNEGNKLDSLQASDTAATAAVSNDDQDTTITIEETTSPSPAAKKYAEKSCDMDVDESKNDAKMKSDNDKSQFKIAKDDNHNKNATSTTSSGEEITRDYRHSQSNPSNSKNENAGTIQQSVDAKGVGDEKKSEEMGEIPTYTKGKGSKEDGVHKANTDSTTTHDGKLILKVSDEPRDLNTTSLQESKPLDQKESKTSQNKSLHAVTDLPSEGLEKKDEMVACDDDNEVSLPKIASEVSNTNSSAFDDKVDPKGGKGKAINSLPTKGADKKDELVACDNHDKDASLPNDASERSISDASEGVMNNTAMSKPEAVDGQLDPTEGKEEEPRASLDPANNLPQGGGEKKDEMGAKDLSHPNDTAKKLSNEVLEGEKNATSGSLSLDGEKTERSPMCDGEESAKEGNRRMDVKSKITNLPKEGVDKKDQIVACGSSECKEAPLAKDSEGAKNASSGSRPLALDFFRKEGKKEVKANDSLVCNVEESVKKGDSANPMDVEVSFFFKAPYWSLFSIEYELIAFVARFSLSFSAFDLPRHLIAAKDEGCR